MNKVAQLYPQALGGQSVVEVEVTFRLTVGQSVRLGVEPTVGLSFLSLGRPL
jgi:hypothetical protein